MYRQYNPPLTVPNCSATIPATLDYLMSLILILDVSSIQGSVLRVALQSLGSPLWLDEGLVSDSTPTVAPTLPQFMHSLRAMLRQSYAVGIVTVPTHLMQVSNGKTICQVHGNYGRTISFRLGGGHDCATVSVCPK